MGKNTGNFVWSDNWWVEDNKAWFVGGNYNILFCCDLISSRCEAVACIPTESKSKFRRNPLCIKSKNYVYCMPDIGSSIWIYDIKKDNIHEILCDNPENVGCRLVDSGCMMIRFL